MTMQTNESEFIQISADASLDFLVALVGTSARFWQSVTAETVQQFNSAEVGAWLDLTTALERLRVITPTRGLDGSAVRSGNCRDVVKFLGRNY